MKKLLLLGLLAACGSTGGTSSSFTSVTHPVNGSSSTFMTETTWGLFDGIVVEKELRIEDGTLLIRLGDSGVRLDMSDFPGTTVTRYFESLDPPLVFDLPDGTRFVFHASSFEVGEETYEIEPGSGVVSYSHPGQIKAP